MRAITRARSLHIALAVSIALVLCVRPGAARAGDEDREREREHSAPARAAEPLPGTYMGFLPCADCMGIRYRLDLLPRGGFIESATYLRDGHDDTLYDIGAWSVTGGTLSLDPARGEPSRWSVGEHELQKLDPGGRPIEPARPYTLDQLGDAPPLVARLKLTGTVRYLPDEVQFRDCRSGIEWPIANGGDVEPLERAYATSGLKPGDALLVSVDARIEARPEADRERELEEGATREHDAEHERDAERDRDARDGGAESGGSRMTMLVIEKFRRAMPGEKCPERGVEASLANTRWRPIRIGDKAVAVASGQQEPWIVLDDRAGRVTGSGGCNRINGSFTAGDGTLRFGALASTRMACPAMELEQRFLAALDATRRFRRSGRTLDLLDDRGKTLARLEERNLD